MNHEHIHFHNRMNGVNQRPLINYSPDGLKMETIIRELEEGGKNIDAPTVIEIALAKGVNANFLNACLDRVHDDEENICIEPRLISVPIQNFLIQEFPPRENILTPWLPSQGICEVYATRGLGKTHFSIGLAVAVAAGGPFLRWIAPTPQGVLFVDGELPAAVLQTWLQEIIAGAPQQPIAPLQIITPDLQLNGMPDIATLEGQELIEECITEDIKLIVLDNISTLVRSGRENEAESWRPVQSWFLKLRAAGKSVLFIHHANKSGSARGTSKREDVLDTVVRLARPSNYSPEMGATFEVHFEKARGTHGDDAKACEVQYQTDSDGAAVWTTKSIEDSNYLKIIKLFNEGLAPKEIVAEIGLHKSNVSRNLKKARANGEITNTNE